MKILSCFFGLCLFFGSTLASDLTLTDGRILKDAKIVSQTPLTVFIKHAAGLSSVSKKILPPELLAQYPIDESAAREADLKSQLAANKARELELAEAARVRVQREELAARNANQSDQPVTDEKSKYQTTRNDVQKYSETYFNGEYNPFTQAKNSSKVSVTISELRLVGGREKYWFVRGKCAVRSYEVVQEYPYYSPKAIRRATRNGEILELDYSPHDVIRYTSAQTRDFEAYYSTENGNPTFDVTLRN